MSRWVVALAAALAIAPGGIAPRAHHSLSSVYDSSRQVTIEGIVAQFQLVNPHPFLLVDVKHGTADAQRWRLEMDNRSELAAIGMTADTLKPGDRIVATGSLARTQGERLYLLRLDRPVDGFWYEQIGPSPRIRTAPASGSGAPPRRPAELVDSARGTHHASFGWIRAGSSDARIREDSHGHF